MNLKVIKLQIKKKDFCEKDKSKKINHKTN